MAGWDGLTHPDPPSFRQDRKVLPTRSLGKIGVQPEGARRERSEPFIIVGQKLLWGMVIEVVGLSCQ